MTNKAFIFIYFFIFAAACKQAPEKIAIKCNVNHLIDDKLEKVVLKNKSLAYLKRMKNKDAIIFLNEANQGEEQFQIYLNAFNALGFDVMILDYSPKDSVNYFYEEIISKIDCGITYLIENGYDSSKVIIYGKGTTCHLAVKSSLRSTVRGIVLDNISDAFFYEIEKDFDYINKPILILQSTSSLSGNWKNAIGLYEKAIRWPIEVKITLSNKATEQNVFFDSDCFNDFNRFYPTSRGMRYDVVGEIF